MTRTAGYIRENPLLRRQPYDELVAAPPSNHGAGVAETLR
jgi:hypothetical protein